MGQQKRLPTYERTDSMQGVDTQPVLVTSVLFDLHMDTYYGEMLVRDTR